MNDFETTEYIFTKVNELSAFCEKNRLCCMFVVVADDGPVMAANIEQKPRALSELIGLSNVLLLECTATLKVLLKPEGFDTTKN